jgi:hypothetical protein
VHPVEGCLVPLRSKISPHRDRQSTYGLATILSSMWSQAIGTLLPRYSKSSLTVCYHWGIGYPDLNT